MRWGRQARVDGWQRSQEEGELNTNLDDSDNTETTEGEQVTENGRNHHVRDNVPKIEYDGTV